MKTTLHSQTGTYAAWCTAHEIGHLLGFIHEHQRPDAGEHVELNCPATIGYDDALKNIVSVKNEPDLASIEDAAKRYAKRMEKVCQSPALAMKYFAGATAWIPGVELLDPKPEDIEQAPQAGQNDDYENIMIYGSETGSNAINPMDPRTWPMTARKELRSNGLSVYRYQIFDGGSYYWYDKSISSGDIERVLQLYPKGGHPQQQAAPASPGKRDGDNSTGKHWAPAKFVVTAHCKRPWNSKTDDIIRWFPECSPRL